MQNGIEYFLLTEFKKSYIFCLRSNNILERGEVFTRLLELIKKIIPEYARYFVESAHSLIESEFYNVEDFRSRDEFFTKTQLYQDFFNIVRPNFSKGGDYSRRQA